MFLKESPVLISHPLLLTCDIKLISQCIHLLEQHEEDLTQWYFSDQNENLMSWLCVERVLDENDRGKLEITSCFPSQSLLVFFNVDT